MKLHSFVGVSYRGIYGKNWRTFFKDLWMETLEDNVFNGAAALSYYFLFSLFPAMIFLLSLLPYLPVPNLYESVMELLVQLLPGEAYTLFSGTVKEITSEENRGLVSFGAILTLWAASTGIHAIMEHLNFTYDVKESRPYWKTRLIATALTVGSGLLVAGAFALILAGTALQAWLAEHLYWGEKTIFLVAVVRWTVILAALLLGFACTYYFGPDVEQEFKYVTPGSAFATALLIAASLGFKFYVENFGQYNATYGGIGAVIVLMLWLNITGLVLLLGSEVNALIEHYNPAGKDKGEKDMPDEAGRHQASATSDRAEADRPGSCAGAQIGAVPTLPPPAKHLGFKRAQ